MHSSWDQRISIMVQAHNVQSITKSSRSSSLKTSRLKSPILKCKAQENIKTEASN